MKLSYKDNITVIFTALSLFLGDLKLDTFFQFLLANCFSKQKHWFLLLCLALLFSFFMTASYRQRQINSSESTWPCSSSLTIQPFLKFSKSGCKKKDKKIYRIEKTSVLKERWFKKCWTCKMTSIAVKYKYKPCHFLCQSAVVYDHLA